MVTLATLLTANTFKTEPIRQMKRKPDQLQSKLKGSSSNNNFLHGFKENERKPDNIQNPKQMTLSTKFNFKFATLQKYSSKKTDLHTAFIQQNQRRKKI